MQDICIVFPDLPIPDCFSCGLEARGVADLQMEDERNKMNGSKLLGTYGQS